MRKRTERKTVQVTAEHIKVGKPGDPCFCPVYLALCAAGVPVYEVNTDSFFLEWYTHEVVMPEEAIERIDRFDSLGVMEPFSFEVEVPV